MPSPSGQMSVTTVTWRSITLQKTWGFRNTTARLSNLTALETTVHILSSCHSHGILELTNCLYSAPSFLTSWQVISQETTCISWIPKIHYRIHKSPPPVPVLSHINPVYTSPSCFLKIHFGILELEWENESIFSIPWTFLVKFLILFCGLKRTFAIICHKNLDSMAPCPNSTLYKTKNFVYYTYNRTLYFT